MDQTIITTKSGKKWPFDGHDWKWLNENTKKHLLAQSKTHQIVVLTNQASVILKGKSIKHLETKIKAICEELDVPVFVFAAIKATDSIYRKPKTGMWDLLVKQLAAKGTKIDVETSFFVGDAAGRPNDFSDSDLKLAENIGIEFKTPEEWIENWNSAEATPENVTGPVEISEGSVTETNDPDASSGAETTE